MTLFHYLALSALLFAIGIYGVLTRRQVLGILMSIELIFNATLINLVAFNRFLYPGNVWGQALGIFILTLAAAEAVVGLSLVLSFHRMERRG